MQKALRRSPRKTAQPQVRDQRKQGISHNQRGYGLSSFAPKKDSKKRELERLGKSNEYEQERKQLQSTVPSMILKILNSSSLTTIDRLLDSLIDGSID